MKALIFATVPADVLTRLRHLPVRCGSAIDGRGSKVAVRRASLTGMKKLIDAGVSRQVSEHAGLAIVPPSR